MNIHPQIISKNKIPEYVVLPINEYKNLISALEEHEDIQEIKKYIANPTETFPLETAEALADGANAIKVLRQYRRVTQQELANKVNSTKQYISQIEKGTRKGSAKLLKNIAQALYIDLDMII